MAKVTLVEICRKYSGNDYRHTLPEQDKVTLGRDKENDIVIDHPFLGVVISRNHCTFIREGDNIRVFDNDSKNGTFVEDKRVGPEGECLHSKDYLYLGNYPFQVEISLYYGIKEKLFGLKSRIYEAFK